MAEQFTGYNIGEIVMRPDGSMVEILDGKYMEGNRLSNWWKWRYVDTGEEDCGYGWGRPTAPAIAVEAFHIFERKMVRQPIIPGETRFKGSQSDLVYIFAEQDHCG